MDATRGSILLRTLTRHSTLAFGLIGAAMAISACTTTCRPATTSIQAPAGPPTVWLLVLEVQQGAVRVLDAKPASGRIVTPRLEERAASLRRRESVWIEYSVRSLVSYLTTYHSGARTGRDLVVLMLGDHEPHHYVSGEDPGHDVPVSVLTRDPDVLAAVEDWRWQPGLRPDPEAPVWRMDSLRDRVLAAFSSR